MNRTRKKSQSPVAKNTSVGPTARHIFSTLPVWKALVAFLLTIVSFVCVTAISEPTKTSARVMLPITVVPTFANTPMDTPPVDTPTVGPTVEVSPTPAASPSPVVTPTATQVSVATAAATSAATTTSATVQPTVAATQQNGGLPKPGATQSPTRTSGTSQTSQATSAGGSNDNHMLANQRTPQNSVFTIPLVILGAVLFLVGLGFLGVRRARAALLPPLPRKKATPSAPARSWQRVRTPPHEAQTYKQQAVPPPSPEGKNDIR